MDDGCGIREVDGVSVDGRNYYSLLIFRECEAIDSRSNPFTWYFLVT